MEQFVYLNGEIVPYAEARIPVEDRGFLFGDGIYEVIRIYHGRPFAFERHLERLRRSAEEIRLPLELERLRTDALELIARQGIPEATLYLQVTRGVAVRNHAFPSAVVPTVLMLVRPASPPGADLLEQGVRCLTVPDDRWARCSIKSINLLPNVLAKQRAVEAGCYEAIYLRDGFMTEGSSSNSWAVFGGELWTAPKSNYILGGITRDILLELARADGIPVREEPVAGSRLPDADELLISSTTSEVLAVVELDGRPVGSGRPGPVWKRLYQLLQGAIDAECRLETAKAR
ncbi:MAG: D-amino-acid transaminase [Chloroflexota bacterium]|nr:D-amino-acid transaminase [Dehalococcoidia bacterium]MDW8255326.1 D-amino-acid transaminase [Chloroflexota bacterium]